MGIRGYARVRARLPGRALRGRSCRRDGIGGGCEVRRAAARAGAAVAPALTPDAGAAEALMADDRRHDVLERGGGYGDSNGDGLVDPDLSEEAAAALEEEEQDIQERGVALLGNRRRVIGLLAAVILLIVAIYVVLPKVVGIGDAIDKVGDAKWYWVLTA